MKRSSLWLSAWIIWIVSFAAYGDDASLDVITLTVPNGFAVAQEAVSEGTKFIVMQREDEVISLYAKSGGAAVDATSIFASQSTVTSMTTESIGPFSWKMYDIKFTRAAGRGENYLSAFTTVYNNTAFYGYSRSSTAEAARSNLIPVLQSMRLQMRMAARSLTGTDYAGKKYYLGWGAAGNGDPSLMQNEVKYDVLHTHDIFTKHWGGDYAGAKMIGPNTSASQIRSEWNRIKGALTSDDMFVQYSSGHGSPSGLGVGVSYTEVRDNVLSYPAREIIVLMMACYSGSMVKAFDQKKEVWQDWLKRGRTLFVMGSSKSTETSSTGPGTDPDQANSPNGSAGSAFGHSLWKSLIGYADGYVDGVKDGFLSLEEIRDFTIDKTKSVGGHTPVATGTYYGGLVMNRVPPPQILERLKRGSQRLSEAEIEEQIAALDKAMAVGQRR